MELVTNLKSGKVIIDETVVRQTITNIAKRINDLDLESLTIEEFRKEWIFNITFVTETNLNGIEGKMQDAVIEIQRLISYNLNINNFIVLAHIGN